MNNFNGIGRLATDVKQGNGVASSLLAVKRIYQSKDGEEDTDFIPITCWGRNADVLSKYTSKGDRVGVSGRIKTSNYKDKQGQQQHGFELVVDHIYLLSNRQDSKSHSALTDADVNELAHRLHQASQKAERAEVTVTDNDLPF